MCSGSGGKVSRYTLFACDHLGIQARVLCDDHRWQSLAACTTMRPALRKRLPRWPSAYDASGAQTTADARAAIQAVELLGAKGGRLACRCTHQATRLAETRRDGCEGAPILQ